MTVKELIQALQVFEGDRDICIDGPDGPYDCPSPSTEPYQDWVEL